MQKKYTIIPIVVFVLLGLFFLVEGQTMTPTETTTKKKISNQKLENDTTSLINEFIDKNKAMEMIVEEGFVGPEFCNARKIIYTNKAGNQLWLKNLINGEVSLLLTAKDLHNNYDWNSNCDGVIYKQKNEKYETTFYSLDIESNDTKALQNIPELTAINSFSVSDVIYFLEEENLQIKGMIGDSVWSVTNDELNYYNLIISPNGDKMVAHAGTNTFVIDLKTHRKKLLCKGIFTDWHLDNEHLIGFIDESIDGHSITNSDILLCNSTTMKTTKITETDGFFEAFPSFIDQNTIGFSDLHKGGVYKMEIEL
ncbi:hypothetical protein [Brumimicrobium aurantiacum]|uniref:DUF5050 domain-containing protein n=1 Tax=Brumimicrobium aurantiacum TaxID=1737063 RepID=A0A3E1F155_9FLAO|nr:hypothetical protein [Brumimicrobium aurantiacum]RFC55540.1 hypothetical protein DXU93_00995 [Brumimicrobium aurantiacum]